MVHKLMAITVAGLIISAALLVIRQERARIARETALIHQQMDHTRQVIWLEQTRAASRLDPVSLRQDTSTAQLALESPMVEDLVDRDGNHYADRSGR